MNVKSPPAKQSGPKQHPAFTATDLDLSLQVFQQDFVHVQVLTSIDTSFVASCIHVVKQQEEPLDSWQVGDQGKSRAYLKMDRLAQLR